MNLCVASNLIFSISLSRYETPPFHCSKCVTFADPIYSRATCIFDNIKLTFYCLFQPIKTVAKKIVFAAVVPMTIRLLFLHLIKILWKFIFTVTADPFIRHMRRSFCINHPRTFSNLTDPIVNLKLWDFLSLRRKLFQGNQNRPRCKWRHTRLLSLFLVKAIRASHT